MLRSAPSAPPCDAAGAAPAACLVLAIPLAVLLAGFAACARSPAAPPENLLLITVDTLRADRLGFAGHERPTSPHLDALAARGTVFTNAVSQSGWTLPSIASVLTGHYPSSHGATRFGRPLSERLPRLAELLAARDHDTRAFVSHVLLGRDYGFDRGFAVFDDSVLDVGRPHRVSTAGEISDRALAALAEVEPPFFVWVHYFDPHWEYLEQAEWRRWGERPIDRYDQEVAHTDRQIGRLLEALEARGLTGSTAVAFTSDHGEEFGEHGGAFHRTLHDEVARVPLVLAGPGMPAAVRAEPVQQVDLLPTILSWLGIEPPADLPGADLTAETLPERPLFLERDQPPGLRQRAVIARGWKLYVIEETAARPPGAPAPAGLAVGPGTRLYHLDADPRERRDLGGRRTETVAALARLLERHERSLPDPASETREIDRRLRRQLQSLGYLE